MSMYCKQCGKPILFIQMTNEKKMPVDEAPVYVIQDETGALSVLTANGRMIRARTSSMGASGAVKAYKPHWANCYKKEPERKRISQEEWRKQRAMSGNGEVRQIHINHPHGNPNEKQKGKAGRDGNYGAEQIALF